MQQRRSKSVNNAVVDDSEDSPFSTNSEPVMSLLVPKKPIQKHNTCSCTDSYDEEDLIEEYLTDDTKRLAIKAGIQFRSRLNESRCEDCDGNRENYSLDSIVEFMEENDDFYNYLRKLAIGDFTSNCLDPSLESQNTKEKKAESFSSNASRIESVHSQHSPNINLFGPKCSPSGPLNETLKRSQKFSLKNPEILKSGVKNDTLANSLDFQNHNNRDISLQNIKSKSCERENNALYNNPAFQDHENQVISLQNIKSKSCERENNALYNNPAFQDHKNRDISLQNIKSLSCELENDLYEESQGFQKHKSAHHGNKANLTNRSRENDKKVPEKASFNFNEQNPRISNQKNKNSKLVYQKVIDPVCLETVDENFGCIKPESSCCDSSTQENYMAKDMFDHDFTNRHKFDSKNNPNLFQGEKSKNEQIRCDFVAQKKFAMKINDTNQYTQKRDNKNRKSVGLSKIMYSGDKQSEFSQSHLRDNIESDLIVNDRKKTLLDHDYDIGVLSGYSRNKTESDLVIRDKKHTLLDQDYNIGVLSGYSRNKTESDLVVNDRKKTLLDHDYDIGVLSGYLRNKTESDLVIRDRKQTLLLDYDYDIGVLSGYSRNGSEPFSGSREHIKRNRFERICDPEIIQTSLTNNTMADVIIREKTLQNLKSDEYNFDLYRNYAREDEVELDNIINLYSRMHCEKNTGLRFDSTQKNGHSKVTEFQTEIFAPQESNDSSKYDMSYTKSIDIDPGKKLGSRDMTQSNRTLPLFPSPCEDVPNRKEPENLTLEMPDRSSQDFTQIGLTNQTQTSKKGSSQSQNNRSSAVQRILRSLNENKENHVFESGEKELKHAEKFSKNGVDQVFGKKSVDMVQLMISPQMKNDAMDEKGPSIVVNVNSNLAEQFLQDKDPNFQIINNNAKTGDICQNSAAVKHEILDNLGSTVVPVEELVDELQSFVSSHTNFYDKSKIPDNDCSKTSCIDSKKSFSENFEANSLDIKNGPKPSIETSSFNSNNAIPVIDKSSGNTKFAKKSNLVEVIRPEKSQNKLFIPESACVYTSKKYSYREKSASAPVSPLYTENHEKGILCFKEPSQSQLYKKMNELIKSPAGYTQSAKTYNSEKRNELSNNLKNQKHVFSNNETHSERPASSIPLNRESFGNLREKLTTSTTNSVRDDEPSNMMTRKKIEKLTSREALEKQNGKKTSIVVERTTAIKTLNLDLDTPEWAEVSSDNTIIDKKLLFKVLDKPSNGLKINKFDFSKTKLSDLIKQNAETNNVLLQEKDDDSSERSLETPKSDPTPSPLISYSKEDSSKHIQEILREAQQRLDSLNDVSIGTGPRPLKRIQKYVFETTPPRLISIANAVDIRQLFRDSLYGKIQKKSRSGFWKTSWFQLRQNVLICYNSKKQRFKDQTPGSGDYIDFMLNPENENELLCPKYSIQMQNVKIHLLGVINYDATRPWGVLRKLQSNIFRCPFRNGLDIANCTVLNAKEIDNVYEITIKDSNTKEIKNIFLRGLEISVTAQNNSKMHLRFLSPRDFLKWMVVFDLRTGKISCPLENIIISS